MVDLRLRLPVLLTGMLLILRVGPLSATTADDLCAPDADPCTVSVVVAVDDGSMIDLGARELVVAPGGRLDVGSGTMTISARSVMIRNGGELRARGSSVDPGGRIQVQAQSIVVAGDIRASGSSGGRVVLAADGRLSVSGSLAANANVSDGVGGSIDLTGAPVTLAGPVSSRGGRNGLGGSIIVSSGGDLLVANLVDGSGSDGGMISLLVAQGNVDVPLTGRLLTDATGSGGSGGTIDIIARGDGVTSGHVSMEGALSANGAADSAFGAGDGGCITLEADGNVCGFDSRGSYEANSGAPDGTGGEINLTAGRDINVRSRLFARGTGTQGIGGTIGIAAGSDLVISGTVSVTGSDGGGDIELAVDRGELVVASTGAVDAGGNRGGDGGSILVDAGIFGSKAFIAGSVLCNGGIATATVPPGLGGTIEIIADALLSVSGRLQAQGENGGTVALSSLTGPLRLDGTVSARGVGGTSAGGTVALSSANELLASGMLDAKGGQTGGMIGIDTTATCTLAGDVVASGEMNGGLIETLVDADVIVRGVLNADGSSAAGARGGQVFLLGCAVQVERLGTLTAAGGGGSNRIAGRAGIFVEGSLLADMVSGTNELVFRVPGPRPIIGRNATIVPPAVETPDTSFTPCAVCGDTRIEFPETCDDGNRIDGDGCSSTCQVELVVRGDVNGDGRVESTDLVALRTELFDGDGDTVGAVRSGGFPGTPGADANADDRITAADLTAIVRLLSVTADSCEV